MFPVAQGIGREAESFFLHLSRRGRGQGLMFHSPLFPCRHHCLSRLVLPERAKPQLRRWAAALRQHLTPEERIMEQEVRGNRLGVHFKRQQPLASYLGRFLLPPSATGGGNRRQSASPPAELQPAATPTWPAWDSLAPLGTSCGPRWPARGDSRAPQCLAARALTPGLFPEGERGSSFPYHTCVSCGH
jgi:uncharacterized protein DUF559